MVVCGRPQVAPTDLQNSNYKISTSFHYKHIKMMPYVSSYAKKVPVEITGALIFFC